VSVGVKDPRFVGEIDINQIAHFKDVYRPLTDDELESIEQVYISHHNCFHDIEDCGIEQAIEWMQRYPEGSYMLFKDLTVKLIPYKGV
jgi:hypothetical protein